MEKLLNAGFAVYTIGIPITYVIRVYDLFAHSHAPLLNKIAIAAVLDPFLAGIWPITWALTAVGM